MRLRLLLVAGLAWCGVMTGTAHGGQTSILIRNVNVFDGASDRLAMDRDDLIESNLIMKIGNNLEADASAGHTLTPGCIYFNMHIALYIADESAVVDESVD